MVNDLHQHVVRHVTKRNNLKERLNGPEYHKSIGSNLIQLLVTQAQLAPVSDIAAALL